MIDTVSSNLSIVLVQTTHPGNIGAAARAMKTMGLQRLVLVAPKFFPDQRAIDMASRADDILAQAQVVSTLPQAIKGCQLVVATSGRPRDIALPGLLPKPCANKLVQEAACGPVALVFGREKSGLSNEEMAYCHYHVQIPANPAYCSLNLAQAVQVLAYEIYQSALSLQLGLNPTPSEYASSEEVQRFYDHLQQVLIDIDFLNPKVPKQLMPRLKRLFNRARLENREVNILRGILTAVQNYRQNRGG